MVKNRILLINPPAFKASDSITPSYISHETAYSYPPLGLLYLASNLPEGVECRVVDALTKCYDCDDCLSIVLEYQPSVIGISVTSDHLYGCKFLADKIKELYLSAVIVMGGVHTTLYPEETIRFGAVDYVLTGYAENSFAALIRLIGDGSKPSSAMLNNIPGAWWKEGDRICHSSREKDTDFDINTIRHPDRTMLDLNDYSNAADPELMTTIMSSRGCPSKCTFCLIAGSGYMFRDIDDIIAEIKEIVALGIRKILFFDDLFNFKRDRVMKFCTRLIEEEIKIEWIFRGRLLPCDDEMACLLKKSGCTRVQLGIEATEQKTLDMIKKGINLSDVPKVLEIYHRHSIRVMGYFIIGFPHQDYQDCKDSCEEIIHMGFDYINMFVLIPYPRTEIYIDLLKDNRLGHDCWLDHARNPQPFFSLPPWRGNIERESLYKLLADYNKKFYFSPDFLLKEIKRGTVFKGFFRKFHIAVSMMMNSAGK